MNIISNKTLIVLLIATIVFSLGGTIINLNKLGSLDATGYTSYDETGTIVLNVEDNLEIFLETAALEFGMCTLIDGTQGFKVNTDGTSTNNIRCSGHEDVEGGITVLNVGNVIANVEIYVNNTDTENSGTFLDISTSGADSTFAYRTMNALSNNGCLGSIQEDYFQFENPGLDNRTVGCSVLSTGTNNSFVTHFQIGIPDNARGESSVLITFYASEAE